MDNRSTVLPKIWQVGFRGLALLIIVFSVVQISSRILFANASRYHQSVENAVALMIHKPVKIKSVHATWHGFQPVIKLRDVEILNNKKSKIVAHVEKLNVGIAIFDSLLKRKLMPGEIILSGLNLNLRQEKDGSVSVNGLENISQHSSSNDNKQALDFINWLLTQGSKQLNHVNLVWTDVLGCKIHFNDLSLYVRSGFLKHNIQASAKLNKTKLMLIASLSGDATNRDSINGKIYLHADKIFTKYFLTSLPVEAYKTDVWVNLKNGKITDARARIQTSGKPSEAVWIEKKNGWTLGAKNVHIASTLAILLRYDLLPKKFRPHLSKVLKKGFIDELHIEKKSNNQFNAKGKFTNLNVMSDGEIPGFDHLNGAFSLNNECGHLLLSANAATFTQKMLFRDALPISELHTEILWNKTADLLSVLIPTLDINLPNGKINSHLKLELKANDDSPLVDMQASFSVNDITTVKQYLPAGVMKPRLVNWMDNAFLDGKITQGKIILKGRLEDFPFDKGDGQFLMTAHASGVDINYKNDWPITKNILADLTLEKRTFKLVAHHAEVLEGQFNDATANIHDLAHPALHLKMRMDGKLSSIMEFIKLSPLNRTIGQQLSPLRLSGAMKLALNVTIPLVKNGQNLHVLGAVSMLDSDLNIPDWRVAIKKLNGRFTFTERGINSETLNGDLCGDPIILGIKTLHSDSDKRTEVDISGVMNDETIKRIVPIPSLQHIEGKADYTAKLRLHSLHDETMDSFHLESNLVGLAIQLPDPIQKAASYHLPLTLDIAMKKNKPSIINVDLESVGKMALKMQNKELKSAHFLIGDLANDIALPTKDAMVIEGKFSELDVGQWSGVLFGKNHRKTHLPQLGKINLSAENLSVFGQDLQDVHITQSNKSTENVIALRSAKVNGDITIPSDFPHHAMDVTLDQLHFYPKESDIKSHLRPNDLPPMNITINEFSFGKFPLGRFELSITPEKNSLKINQISCKSQLMALSASGQWDMYEGHQKTRLSGAMYTHNLGTMLNVFDITDNVMEGDGRALFNLAWDDSLINYALSKMNGWVNFEFKKGEVIKLSKEAAAKVGVGRVLNLFSLQSLPKRLSLDFSDFTKEGFLFDVLNGHIALRNGNAFTRDSVMKGSVASVNLKGRLGLKDKDYQMSLMITPHVTSSLPVVATVAGGPAAGVAAFVVEKIFRHAVNKVTTISYKVTGPWAHPKIKALS